MLSPKEQEKFFGLVRKRFKDWSAKRASGYVHGVVDGFTRKEPRRVYIRKFGKSEYATGYIHGFIDCYGADAMVAEWSKQLELSERSLEYRWWNA